MIYDPRDPPHCIACRAEAFEKKNPDAGPMGLSEAFIMGASHVTAQLQIHEDEPNPGAGKPRNLRLVLCPQHEDMMRSSLQILKRITEGRPARAN